MSFLTLSISTLAAALLLISALGLLRLPNALNRQHAVTKAASIALSLFILALLVHSSSANWDNGWTIKLSLLLIILLITLPLASHALAKSSLNELDKVND